MTIHDETMTDEDVDDPSHAPTGTSDDRARRIHEATLRLLGLPDLDVFVGADWVVPYEPSGGTRPVLVVRDAASGDHAERIDIDQVETVLTLHLRHGPAGIRAWTGIRRGRPLDPEVDRTGPEARARAEILRAVGQDGEADDELVQDASGEIVGIAIPDGLEGEVFALQHDPEGEARWTVRLPTRGGLDMLPLDNGFAATNDAVGTGTSLTEALGRARREQERRRTR